MSSQESSVKIALVGGGITALTCAFNLEKLAALNGVNIQITIFEQEAELGGKLKSGNRGDFLVEFGPDSIATRQPAVMMLINEVGMASEIVVPKQRQFSIMRSGKMQLVDLSLLAPFPRNIRGLFATELVSFSGKMRACLGGALDFLSSGKVSASKADRDLASYFRRKWGNEMSRNLLEPLFSGLYGGDLEKISQTVIQVNSSASSASSKPKSPYIGFKNGIFSLINAIKNNLKHTTFCCSEAVKGIQKSETGIMIKSDKDSFEFSICLITTPARAASRLLLNSLPKAAKLLSDFEASDAAIVSLGFSSFNQGLLDLAGSGVIVPASESSSIRGITISSRKWENRAPDGSLLLRVFGREGVFENLSQEQAVSLAKAEVERLLKISGEISYSELHSWKSGSALCAVGHQQKVRELKDELGLIPGLFVAGAPYGGVGIGDCIESATKVAHEIISLFTAFSEEKVI